MKFFVVSSWLFVPVIFQFHAEAVGETVDKSIIRRDLANVKNGGIGKSGAPQDFDVCLRNGGRLACQLHRVIEHRAIGRGDFCLAIICAQCGNELLVFG